MRSRFFILIGVSGCGKTTVGRALADQLGWDFYDADDFHPPKNIAKMTSGIPLNDADRLSWLASLHGLISSCLKDDHPGVLACSALKERYRQTLLAGNPGVQLVYLRGGVELVAARMAARGGHYMKLAMLQSQFDALEEPANALSIDISLSIEEIVKMIVATLK
jgi:gluconokinase